MIKYSRINILFIKIFVFFFTLCSRAIVPTFNQDRSYDYLKKQCQFGPRNPGSKGHEECLKFFIKEFKTTADTVILQPFLFTNPRSSKTTTLNNVIASFGNKKEHILLCAHWDTRPWADLDSDPENRNKPILGANDGASGVAVLLEIAQILKQNPPHRRVDFVLFDGEDAGINGQLDTWCKGSRFFARNKKPGYNPVYAILIDLIGDRDLHIPIEGNSQKYVPGLVDLVWGKASELGLSAFDYSPGYPVIDDHLELLKVGIPAVDIIDFDYPFWHTLQDTEDKCSPRSLGIIGTLLLHLIYE